MGTFLPAGADHAKGVWAGNPLNGVVRALPPHVRQAMLAASRLGQINRRTWDNCAFNAAGKMHNERIDDFEKAAHVFGIKVSTVQNFISKWDALTCDDKEANRLLIEAINEVGSHTPTGGRVVRGFAFKGAATKFAEQLDAGELTVADIPGCQEIAELLSSCLA